VTVTVHHLNNSRSQRILWLLEELNTDYDIVPYQRDAETNLAPPELKQVHPLGKSPLIEDNGLQVAESGAIIQYLCERHGGGSWLPEADTEDHVRHLEWMQFGESSFFVPVMLKLYTGRAMRRLPWPPASTSSLPRMSSLRRITFQTISISSAVTGRRPM